MEATLRRLSKGQQTVIAASAGAVAAVATLCAVVVVGLPALCLAGPGPDPVAVEASVAPPQVKPAPEAPAPVMKPLAKPLTTPDLPAPASAAAPPSTDLPFSPRPRMVKTVAVLPTANVPVGQPAAKPAIAATAEAPETEEGTEETQDQDAPEPAGDQVDMTSSAVEAPVPAPLSERPPEPQVDARTIRSAANVRATPSRSGEVLFALDTGTAVTAGRTERGWIEVTDPKGRTGWVYGDFVD